MGGLLERGIDRCRRVVAISERTADEIRAAGRAKSHEIIVIPLGRGPFRPSTQSRDIWLSFGGGSDPRKRLDLTIDAYSLYAQNIRDPLPLVVLGRAGLTPSQIQRLSMLRARVVTGANWEDVDDLLARSRAVLFPSRAEGGALPIVEAGTRGTRVLIDRSADLPKEVVGRHCVAIEGNATDWAGVMAELGEETVDSDPLDLPTWDEVADAYLDVYRSARD
jgi:glycosyltransferase involved in cell wall biosynthesis